MVINPEQKVIDVLKVFNWRRDREDDWSRNDWHGHDPAKTRTELDAEAYKRISKLFN